MFEETIHDPRTGQPINNNFADYIVPTCADLPDLDVTFLDYPDLIVNEYGARGIGEIGMAGVAPGDYGCGVSRHRRAGARIADPHRRSAEVNRDVSLRTCAASG